MIAKRVEIAASDDLSHASLWNGPLRPVRALARYQTHYQNRTKQKQLRCFCFVTPPAIPDLSVGAGGGARLLRNRKAREEKKFV